MSATSRVEPRAVVLACGIAMMACAVLGGCPGASPATVRSSGVYGSSGSTGVGGTTASPTSSSAASTSGGGQGGSVGEGGSGGSGGHGGNDGQGGAVGEGSSSASGLMEAGLADGGVLHSCAPVTTMLPTPPIGSPCVLEDGGTGYCDGVQTCGTNRYVFVTSSAFPVQQAPPAGFSSESQADKLCDTFAATGHLASSQTTPPATWVAWLSDSSSSAAVRVGATNADASTVWLLVDAKHTVAIASPDVLTGKGSLKNAISTTEAGDTLADTAGPVWTGTTADGTLASSGACDDWDDANDTNKAVIGYAFGTGSPWTDMGPALCTSTAHLYCFLK